MGNNPNATGGTLSEQSLLEGLAESRHEEDPGVTAEQLGQELGQMSQTERFRVLGRAAFREVADQPTLTIERRLWAALYFVFGRQWFTDQKFWRGEWSPGLGPAWLANAFPAILIGSLLGMLGLAFLGWRWAFGWRHLARPSALAVVWIPLPYVLSHAETLSGPRLPLDGVLLCLAALALCCLVPRLGRPLFRGPVLVAPPAPPAKSPEKKPR
jgi:hypothetical protein